MSEVTPTFADWYPDTATGGTKYWDGTRWTGDTRPPRRPFAAAARDNDRFWLLFLALGAPGLAFLGAFDDEIEGFGAKFLWFVSGIVLLLALIAYGIYLFRGQGPTTASIEQRLAEEEKSARGRRRSANLAAFAERLVGRGRLQQPAPPRATRADTNAAQIDAIASGETTRSLEKLQHLLYSGAITEAEYQATKAKLLGTQTSNDPFAQVAKLAELHRDGVLGDLEFAAAKARVLGL